MLRTVARMLCAARASGSMRLRSASSQLPHKSFTHLPIITLNTAFIIPNRCNHNSIRSAGGKGHKKHQSKTAPKKNDDDDDDNDDDESINIDDAAAPELQLDDNQYDHIANTAMRITRTPQPEQRVFIIQPFVKWGPRKSDIEPELRLQEAEALVRSLPGWSICRSLLVPLESLGKKHLFGSGKLQEIRQTIGELRGAGTRISCMFVSKGTLSGVQKRFLEQYFGMPVLDRYSVVIQILRLHATSNEAKLQVAAAEIPYIWSQMRDGSGGLGVGDAPAAMHTLNDVQKEMLRTRERKLRIELRRVRARRELLRHRRQQLNIPIVAVVGYTNAGKTSLIQALTADAEMQPRNQLFATLDVTAHAGLLPCKMKAIYMDTVGFMSDIPTGLIESFVATLEDAMLADVVVHVRDVSHPMRVEQGRHVEQTLRELMASSAAMAAASASGQKSGGGIDANTKYNRLGVDVIQVGNKIDLLKPSPEANDEDAEHPFPDNMLRVSSKTGDGIEALRAHIEEQLLRVTRRSRMTIKVPMGGAESSWLYKNTAVTEAAADPHNAQNLLLSVVISETELQKFRHQFVRQHNVNKRG